VRQYLGACANFAGLQLVGAARRPRHQIRETDAHVEETNVLDRRVQPVGNTGHGQYPPETIPGMGIVMAALP
jgi:hypothetical protein